MQYQNINCLNKQSIDIILLQQTFWCIKAFPIFLLGRKKINQIKKWLLLGNILICKTNKNSLTKSILFFKQHTLSLYKQLIDIAAEDTPQEENRFRVNYILMSIYYNSKMFVTTTTNGLTYVPTATIFFESATWLEREVWDLFGIYFRGNKDLRRILTDYGFSGHPLRKDFPMTGFYEDRYSLNDKKIKIVPVFLTQEYRAFN